MKTGNRARNLVRAGKGFHGDLSTRVGAHGATCLLPQICLLLPPAILPTYILIRTFSLTSKLGN